MDPVVDPAPAAGEPAAEPAVETTTWRDSLPEPLKVEKTLEKFKGVEDLAKGYVNLEKHAGSAIKIPGDNATPEERKSFFAKLGVPATPEEYGVEAKVPEGLPWNKDAEKTFLRKMHTHGLTKAQAQGILDDYLGLVQEGHVLQSQEKARSAEDAYAAVSQEWGGLTDRNVSLVQRVVAEQGGAEFKAYLDETGLGNDPRFLKFVHAMAQPMLEAGHIKGENLGMTRADAKVELERIMKMPEYLKGDKALVEKTRELAYLAYGDDGAAVATFQDRYKDVVREYRETPAAKRDDVAKRLREQTLERADRREWAHKRRGDESRFNE